MRNLIYALTVTAVLYAADASPSVTVSGKLTVPAGRPAQVETRDHKTVKLDGDETTRKVLADARFNGYEVQARGHFAAPGLFVIDPVSTHAMLVRQGEGKLKLVTYWCDVCSLRSNTPGPCACCEKETTLDLVDPSEVGK